MTNLTERTIEILNFELTTTEDRLEKTNRNLRKVQSELIMKELEILELLETVNFKGSFKQFISKMKEENLNKDIA